MRPPRVLRETFESLHASRNFRLFFAGQIVSVTGTWVQQVASAWLVLRLTGSGVALGIDTGLTFLPLLLLGVRGGSLADRADRRRILMVSNAVLGVLAVAMWALVDTGVVRLWMVYGMSLLTGVVTAYENPARQSFYAEMVDREHLANAVSLNSAVMTGTRVVGPAIAAALIAGLGMAWCFLVNGVSYLAAIAGLWAMRPEELRRSPTVERGTLRATLAYVRSDDALWMPLALMAVLYTLSFNFSVIVPLLAERTFRGDVGTYGTFLSCMGIGSFVGALIMARIQGPNVRRLAWLAVAFGAACGLVALAPSREAAMAVLVPFGVVAMAFMITGNSALQLAVRPEMRGRVMALYAIVFLGGTPIGAPIAGALAEHLGPREAMAFGGLVAAIAGVSTVRLLALRRSDPAHGSTPA